MVIIYVILLFATTLIAGQNDDINDNKIIGGEIADVGEFPYIVSVQTHSSHICGGSLIHTSVVLTACHCLVVFPDRSSSGGRLKPKSPSEYNVVGGIVNLAKRGFSSFRRLNVNDVKPHPKCEKPDTGWNWDYGLMQTKGAFPNIPERLQTIDVPKFSELQGMVEKWSDLEVQCVGAGWGITAERSKTASLELLKVDLQLVPIAQCEDRMKKYAESVGSSLRFKPEAQVCTLGENGKDACKGDSGGPLLCDTSSTNNGTRGKKLLIATVSWGIGCGRPDVPGGWARLDAAYDWIVQVGDDLQRTAPSGENGIIKKDVIVNLLLTAAVINAHLYSSS